MYAQWIYKGRKNGTIHILTTHPPQEEYGLNLYNTLRTMGCDDSGHYSKMPWFMDTACDSQIGHLAWFRMMETIYNPPTRVTEEYLNPGIYLPQSSFPSNEVMMYKNYNISRPFARLNILKDSLVSLGFQSPQDASSRSIVLKRLYGGILLFQTILLGYYKDFVAYITTELYKSGHSYHSIPEIRGT